LLLAAVLEAAWPPARPATAPSETTAARIESRTGEDKRTSEVDRRQPLRLGTP
jgi:hypothetical protein